MFLADHRLPQAVCVHSSGRRCFSGSNVCSARRSERQAVATKARAPQNGDGQSSPPPDMATMFREAQNNIMRLNQSRLKALEELKTARSRITELGEALIVHSTSLPILLASTDVATCVGAETRLAEAAAQSDSKSIQFGVAEPADSQSGRGEDVRSAASRSDLQSEATVSSVVSTADEREAFPGADCGSVSKSCVARCWNMPRQ